MSTYYTTWASACCRLILPPLLHTSSHPRDAAYAFGYMLACLIHQPSVKVTGTEQDTSMPHVTPIMQPVVSEGRKTSYTSRLRPIQSTSRVFGHPDIMSPRSALHDPHHNPPTLQAQTEGIRTSGIPYSQAQKRPREQRGNSSRRIWLRFLK